MKFDVIIEEVRSACIRLEAEDSAEAARLAEIEARDLQHGDFNSDKIIVRDVEEVQE